MGSREEHVASAIREHRGALLVGLLVADRGDDGLGTSSTGELLHAGHGVDGRGIDDLVGPDPAGHLEAVRIDLADDDPRPVLLRRDDVHQAHDAGAQDHDVLADVDPEHPGRVEGARERLGQRRELEGGIAGGEDRVCGVRLVLGKAARPPRRAVFHGARVMLPAGPVLAGPAPVALAAR